MNQKYFYVVDYFIPGEGLFNVIASDDEECFDLIVKWDGDTWPEHYGKLRENIIKSERFPLLKEQDSRIVEAFIA